MSIQRKDLSDIADQIAEIERDILEREKVYPQAVQSGRLTQSQVDQRMARIKGARDSLVAYSALRLKYPEEKE